MMGHRGAKKGPWEWDAFTSWRRVMPWKPSQLKAIKRKYNKRMRWLAKMECKLAARLA
jgi:hypothetical protein